MISPEEFVAKWEEVRRKESPLVCANPAALDSLNLPDEAKQFLARAGLPCKVLRYFNFDRLAEELFPIPADLTRNLPNRERFDSYIVIGEVATDTLVCIEEKTGWLYLFGTEDACWKDRTRFLNSSISHFAECVLAKAQYRLDLLKDPSYERREELADELQNTMENIDAEAMRNSENF